MNVALTIEDLDEAVAERLRLWAAQHSQSIEAEARDILIEGIYFRKSLPENAEALPFTMVGHPLARSVGSWEGRGTTDESMKDLRGGG